MHANDWKEELKNRLDIVEIVEQHTKLRRAGKTLRGPCPLHGGQGPNFSVYPEKQIFKCFVCNKGGNVFKFLMELSGLDFSTVARAQAERIGFTIPTWKRPALDTDARVRADAQDSFFTAERVDLWKKLGIEDSVSTFHLGTREGAEERCLIPVWDIEDQGAPKGWVSYGVSPAGIPVNKGFDPLSKEGLDGSLFVSPGAIHGIRDTPLVFVVDPIIGVLLHEKGYNSVFSVVGDYREKGEAWFSSHHLEAILEKNRKKVNKIGLLVPYKHSDRETQTNFLRALFATEPVVSGVGAEPVLLSIPEASIPGSVDLHGWKWLSGLDSGTVKGLWSEDQMVDIFEMRVNQLVPLIHKKTITHAIAVEKLLPSLAVIKAKDPLLYESYVAWAVKNLGINRTYLMLALEGDSGEAAEEF